MTILASTIRHTPDKNTPHRQILSGTAIVEASDGKLYKIKFKKFSDGVIEQTGGPHDVLMEIVDYLSLIR